MTLFSKTPASVLADARVTLQKRHAAFTQAEGRSRTALERLNLATSKLDTARALGVEAASNGEQPQSLRALENEHRDAVHGEHAFAAALTLAEDALTRAKDGYRAAESAERVHRYREVVGRLSDALDAAAAVQGELSAIYAESPKTLPIMALPFLAPTGLAFWKAEVAAFVVPKPPHKLPASQTLVRIIKSTVGAKDGAGGTVGNYSVGETAAFPIAFSERLIIRGYAVAV